MKIQTIKSYGIITIGLIINALGWTAFLIPGEIVGGGFSGIGSLLYFATGFPVGVTVFMLNSVFILIAIKILGAQFGIKTLYAIIVQALTLSIFQYVITEPIVHESFMAAVIGGILLGAGIGMVFTQGGSTGGTDIIAMILNKLKHIRPGRTILALDVLIISSSFFIFGSLEKIVYGLVTMAICAYAIDMTLEGRKQSAHIFVISSHSSQIATKILHDLKRGVTSLKGKGCYTNQEVDVLMLLVKKYEIQQVCTIIQELDPQAFISVGTVMGVYGRGFEQFRN